MHFRVLIASLCCLWLAYVFYFSTDSIQTESESPRITNPSWQKVIEYAREHLPMEGQLMITSDGFGYLKVDDNYIHTLFPMLGLQDEGFKEPPFFRTKGAPGAHISVFYAGENIAPEEIGKYFRFDLKKISVKRTSRNAIYVVLEIKSPELEKLREKYGLSHKLFGHNFHISLAKKTIRTEIK